MLIIHPSLAYPSLLTREKHAPVHVEQAPRRREAVSVSGRRMAGVVRDREQRPGHGGGVERVQVAKKVCGAMGKGTQPTGECCQMLT